MQLNGFKFRKWFHSFYLTHRWDPNRYYHHTGSVDRGIMTMKEYSTFPRSTDLEPHHQVVVMLRTPLWGSFTSLQGTQSTYSKTCLQGVVLFKFFLDKALSIFISLWLAFQSFHFFFLFIISNIRCDDL